MMRRGFTTIISNPASGGASNIPTPMLAFVDNVNGNNSTAVFGRMDKPFATLNAAYAAGVASGQPFGCIFMPSNTAYELTADANLSALCKSFSSFSIPANPDYESQVKVTINAIPATAINANGSTGYSGSIAINGLHLALLASGGAVEATDGQTYNGGNGGIWTITGEGRIECVLSGGGGTVTAESLINGGNAGSLTLQGNLTTASNGIVMNPGVGAGGGGGGGSGVFAADGCDLRIGPSLPSGMNVTLGRCSYFSNVITVLNNKGGNADYA